MEYEKLTFSEQLVVRILAKLLSTNYKNADQFKDEVSEDMWRIANEMNHDRYYNECKHHNQ